jgi:hypothetical protein
MRISNATGVRYLHSLRFDALKGHGPLMSDPDRRTRGDESLRGIPADTSGSAGNNRCLAGKAVAVWHTQFRNPERPIYCGPAFIRLERLVFSGPAQQFSQSVMKAGAKSASPTTASTTLMTNHHLSAPERRCIAICQSDVIAHSCLPAGRANCYSAGRCG